MGKQIRAQKVLQIELIPHVTITDDDIKHAYAEAKAIDTKLGPIDDRLRETLQSSLWAKKLCDRARGVAPAQACRGADREAPVSAANLRTGERFASRSIGCGSNEARP